MSEAPTPLAWRTLAAWIRETRRVDDEHHRPARALPGARSGRRRGPGRFVRPRLDRAVFVVGAPRSGTSFLGATFQALPDFSYHYEPPLAKALARVAVEEGWSEPRWRRAARALYGWLLCRHGEGDLRLAEKTPQNCFVVERLARAFPDARFVHIVRDGRDAALSYRDKPWLSSRLAGSGRRETGGYPLGPTPRFWVEPERRREFRETSDLHRCIWAWRRHTEAARAGLAALAAGRSLTLRYETLVSDPAREGRRLLDFLELGDPAAREAALAHLAGAHGRGVGRWRDELSRGESECVMAEAGGLLAELGYASPGPQGVEAESAR
ncbi:MAG: sulfotransferase family protein [Myxococcota bacterium]